jgi:hypothetical protein
LGTFGIIETIISGGNIKVSEPAMAVCILVISAVFTLVYNAHEYSKYIMGILSGSYLIICMLSFRSIKNGIIYIFNYCMMALEKPYKIILPRISQKYIEGRISSADCFLALFMLAVLVALVISFVVCFCRSMTVALISVLPVLILFIFYVVMPSSFSIILCVTYVFGVAAINRKTGADRAAIAIMGLCLVIAVIIGVAYPKTQYKKSPIFKKLEVFVESKTDQIEFNYKQQNTDVVDMGIGDGKLGTVDRVQYKNKKVFTLTTAITGKNQYIQEFIGKDYQNNAWDKNYDNDDLAKDLMMLLDKKKMLRDYIDGGSGDYYNIFMRFDRTVIDLDNRVRTKKIYFVDLPSYSKFKSLSNQETPFSRQMFGNVYLDYGGYLDYALSDKMNVYARYLTVPPDVKSIIVGLMGDVTVNTQEQKEYYLGYVKDYLAKNYTYTLAPGKVPEGVDFIKHFLLDSKQGYCTYFATAAVMMYRSAGIPARYVEGYLVNNSQINDGKSTILEEKRADDNGDIVLKIKGSTCDVYDTSAHAWVEVFMDGYGWVPVEVTPGNQPTPGTAFLPESQGTQEEQTTQQSESATELTSTSNEEMEISTEATNEESVGAVGDQGNISGNRIKWVRLIPWFIVLIVIMMITAVIIWYKKKRMFVNNLLHYSKPQHIENPIGENRRNQLLQIYDYFEKLASFFGYDRPDGVDYEAYAEYLSIMSPIFKDNDVVQMMNFILEVRFGNTTEVNEEELRTNMKRIRKMRNELYKQLPWQKKLIFTYIQIL